MDESRVVITHLHLFKNAGTSVEQGLQTFFGRKWISYDKEGSGGRITESELVAHLRARPKALAVSSHQLRPPLGNVDEFTFLPIVFLRHPLDRIRSAYDFERNQGGVSPSSRAASDLDMAGWIDFHHERSSTQCQNFQTMALTDLRTASGGPLWRLPIDRHLAAAMEFITELPAFGLVETFDESWGRIADWIRSYYPSFTIQARRANSTTDNTESLGDRLDAMATQLGHDKYDELVQHNQADLQLFEWVSTQA